MKKRKKNRKPSAGKKPSCRISTTGYTMKMVAERQARKKKAGSIAANP